MRGSANASITLTNSVGLSPPQLIKRQVLWRCLLQNLDCRKSALQFGAKSRYKT
ncbi:hypothetical protein [Nostoc sp.]|uniref:hypothetical protein n=1 Tax=Nostoc sp. TaxID=1180 RepID=UPI002FF4B36B